MENWERLGFIGEDGGRVPELAEESFNNTEKIYQERNRLVVFFVEKKQRRQGYLSP